MKYYINDFAQDNTLIGAVDRLINGLELQKLPVELQYEYMKYLDPYSLATFCLINKVYFNYCQQNKNMLLKDKQQETDVLFFKYINTSKYYKSGIANVNATNKYGNTGLYYAIWNNDVKMVELLLSFGADPTLAIIKV